MYALIYKNRVIVGPMGWNRGIFQGSLEKEGVVQTLPRVAPEQLPYTVTEDVMVMRVEEARPEINPMVEYHLGPIWDITETTAIANYEVMDTPIEFARINLKKQAAAERYKKEVAGTKVTIQDTEVSIDTSRDGRNIFVQKYSLIGDDQAVNWKFPEGWLILAKQDIGAIITTSNSYIQSCFDWEKEINNLIDAAETKEELVEIKIVEENNLQEEEKDLVE